MEAKITVESLAPTDLTYQYDSFENSSPSKLSEERHHKGEQKRIFNDDENGEKSDNKCRAGGGYEVSLRTEARRVRDGAVIAEGTHSVWLPDYMQM